jgi:hypothetical protein
MPRTPGQKKGKLGEKHVDSLATAAGFTVQTPTEDEHGWDRMLELETATNSGKSLDHRAGPLTAFLQIKTTSSRTKESIKLDVLERMAKDSVPWFIMFVVLGQDNKPADIHVVHVGRDLIELVLKRLRVEAANGVGHDALHKHSMSINWKDGQRVAPDDDEAFRKSILESIGDPSTYPRRKDEIRTTAGFTARPLRVSVVFGDDVGVDRIADAFIGIGEPTLPVKSLKAKEVRFGIELPLERLGGPGLLQIRAKDEGDVDLSFEGSRGGRVSLPMKRLAPPLNLVGREAWKVRFSNSILSIIVKPSSGELSLELDLTNDTKPLWELERVADVLALLETEPGPVRLQIEVDDRDPWHTQLSHVDLGRVPPWMRDLLRGGKAIAALMRLGSYDVQRHAVHLGEVEHYGPSALALFEGLNKDSGEATVVPTVNSETLPVINRFETVSIAVGYSIPLLDRVLTVVFSVDGPPARSEPDGKLQLTVAGKARYLGSKLFVRKLGFGVARDVFLNELAARERAVASETTGLFFEWEDPTRARPETPSKSAKKRLHRLQQGR